jgi:hypothetical protein
MKKSIDDKVLNCKVVEPKLFTIELSFKKGISQGKNGYIHWKKTKYRIEDGLIYIIDAYVDAKYHKNVIEVYPLDIIERIWIEEII